MILEICCQGYYDNSHGGPWSSLWPIVRFCCQVTPGGRKVKSRTREAVITMTTKVRGRSSGSVGGAAGLQSCDPEMRRAAAIAPQKKKMEATQSSTLKTFPLINNLRYLSLGSAAVDYLSGTWTPCGGTAAAVRSNKAFTAPSRRREPVKIVLF